MTLGELIKEYREDKGVSQRQFAQACNLSNGFISMVEKSYNPKTKQPITLTLNSIKKIADGMGSSVDDLIERTEDIPVMLSDLYDRHSPSWITDLGKHTDDDVIKEKPAAFSNDGLTLKKRALIKAIIGMDDSDIDVISAAADALIARREK